MKNNTKYVKFALALFVLVFVGRSTSFAKDIELPEKSTTDQFKIWTIKFNKNIDYTHYFQNISIEDERGTKCLIEKSTISNNTITIFPPERGYRDGTFYIKINNGIKSKDNKILKDTYTMKFTVKKSSNENNEEVVIVDNYNKLSSVFKNNIKNFKIVDNNVNLVYKKANEILHLIIKPDMSDLEKEIAIHDYVVKNTVYDYKNYLNNTIPPESYSVYGVLMKGIGVCDGYAKTMDLLLNMAGIETYIIGGKGLGEPHAWNIVKIDGEYYHLDSTWDDPAPDMGPNYVRHTYLNLSDKEMSRSHSWDIASYIRCDSKKFDNLSTLNYDHSENGFVFYIGNEKNISPFCKCVYRLNLKNSNIDKIFSGEIFDINFDSGYMFYIDKDKRSLSRINLDGTDKTLILNKINSYDVSEGWIYYEVFKNGSWQGIRKVRIDGTGDSAFTRENSGNELEHNYEIKDIIVEGGWVYYIYNDYVYKDFKNEVKSSGIYKIKTDGTNEVPVVIKNSWLSIDKISDGWVYYYVSLDNDEFKIKTDSSEEIQLIDAGKRIQY